MITVRRRGIAVITGVVLTILVFEARAFADSDPNAIPWPQVGQIAQDFVDRETPSSAWPFSTRESSDSTRKVFIHYFTPMQLTPDNKPAVVDYWNTQALLRSGIGGKYAAAGGYVRERPLPVGPWPEPYWREINAAIDVLRAQRIGADGFIVGLFQLPSGQYWVAARRLCAAAAAVAPGFAIIFQLDADALNGASPEAMASAVVALAQCNAAYRTDDERLMITAFNPARMGRAFWQQFLARTADRGVPVAFVPILLNPLRSVSEFAGFSYAVSSWGPADPGGVDGKGTGVAALRKMLIQLRAKWMAPVRPQDFRPKSGTMFEAANTATFRRLWMQAIQWQAPYVHVITWNDYTEATEIEPSSRTQFLYYDLSAFFINWYKTGRQPAVQRDAIYYSHRGQIFEPLKPPQPGDYPLRLLGLTPIQNRVEMLTMLTAPATITIEIGGQQCSQNAPAGLAILECPASPGRPLFRITRGPSIVAELRSDWEISTHPERADPLYFGGSSTRSHAEVPPPR